MRACIYARKSTHKLGQKETIENQIKICRTKAKELGLDIVDIKQDIGTGTDDLNRPEVKKLIEDAVSGNYECVIMKGISRLFRDTEKGLGLIKQLDRHDIRVVTVEEMFDSGNKDNRTGTGKLDLSRITMYLMFAEMESKKLADRVKYTQIEKAKSGEWNQAASPPFGYDFNPDTKKLKINTIESQIVKKIFQLYLNGMGMRTIMHYLNGDNEEKQIFSKPKHADLWDQTTVAFILKNQVYVGDIVYNKRSRKERPYKSPASVGKTKDDIYVGNDFNNKEDWIVTPNAHDLIIERSMFEKIQDMIDAKAKRKGVRNNTSILAGIGKCGLCGAGLSFKRGRRDPKTGHIKSRNNYYCSNYIKFGKNVCDSYHVRADELIELVTARLNELYMDRKLIDKIAAKNNIVGNSSSDSLEYEKNKQNIETEIKKVATKMDKLLEKNLNGEITDQQFTMMNKRYSDELSQLTKMLEEVNSKIANSTTNDEKVREFNKTLDEAGDIRNLNDEQKRYLFLKLIDKIIVFPDGAIDTIYHL